MVVPSELEAEPLECPKDFGCQWSVGWALESVLRLSGCWVEAGSVDWLSSKTDYFVVAFAVAGSGFQTAAGQGSLSLPG